MSILAYSSVDVTIVNDGVNGEDGVGVKEIVIEYNISSSKVTPGDTWSTTPPTWQYGQYLWSRNKITYTNNDVKYTTPQCDNAWEAANGAYAKVEDVQNDIQQIAGKDENDSWYLKDSIVKNTYVYEPQRNSDGSLIYDSNGNLVADQNKPISMANSFMEVYKTTDGIKQIVSDRYELIEDRIDNIKIGGRNLFKDANNLKSSNWNISGNVTRFENSVTLVSTDTTIETRLYQMPAKGYWTWLPNTTYTVSVNAYRDSSSSAKLRFVPNGALNVSVKNFDLTTVSKRYSYTFTTGVNVNTGSMTLLLSGTGTMYLSEPKLEVGTTPTDWSVAPEDIDEKISENTSLIRANTSTIEQNSNYIGLLVDTTQGSSSLSLKDGFISAMATKGVLLESNEDIAFISKGAVFKTDLSTSGNTTINGDNITTGFIKSKDYQYTSGNFSDSGIAFDLENSSIISKNFLLNNDGLFLANGIINISNLSNEAQDRLKRYGNRNYILNSQTMSSGIIT